MVEGKLHRCNIEVTVKVREEGETAYRGSFESDTHICTSGPSIARAHISHTYWPTTYVFPLLAVLGLAIKHNFFGGTYVKPETNDIKFIFLV